MISQTKKNGQTIHFAIFDGSLSLEECRNCKALAKVQGAGRAPGKNVNDEEGYRATHWLDIFGEENSKTFHSEKDAARIILIALCGLHQNGW